MSQGYCQDNYILLLNKQIFWFIANPQCVLNKYRCYTHFLFDILILAVAIYK